MVWDGSAALSGLIGGVLIGLAATALLLFNGRVAGISGILGGLLRPTAGEWPWRLAFVGGLLGGGWAAYALAPGAFAITVERPLALLVLGGLLVGFGARLGSGCTSGHGVCGLSRFSPRSWVATPVFVAAGVATVFVLNQLLGA